MVTIADYGLGNLNSVSNMVRRVGGVPLVTGDPEKIAASTRLILPGVGAFDHGMMALRDRGIIPALQQAVFSRKVPVLGICLGMQLMTRGSEEGSLPGLGWIDGEARKFRFAADTVLKVPHMGWNTLSVKRANPLVPAEGEQRFYFVHSYFVTCDREEDTLATCFYGHPFAAAFQRENIWGVQFHPEKSHRFGMALFKSFLEMPHA